MAARKDDPTAVERSLEDFIARANTTLPAPEPEVGAALGRRRKEKKDGTLVVVGSQQPLAEVTEIVTRLPAETLDTIAPRRRWTSLRFGLIAFLAGAIAVLVITRFIGGGPKPLPPVAPPPAPTVVAAPAQPPIIVQPLPAPEPAAAAPAPAPTPAPEPAAAAAAPEPAPKPRANHKPAKSAAKPDKKSTGLVDPFAQ